MDVRRGLLRFVEIGVEEAPNLPLDFSGMVGEQIDMINLGDILGKMGQRTKRRRLKVPAAFAKLIEEEADRRLDQDEISREALANAEANGIVFLDEVDK